MTLQLYRDGGLLEETAVRLPEEGGTRETAFKLNHPQTGTFLYRVAATPLHRETVTNDNVYAVTVQVVDTRNRLLYIEGPPRWESKFLSRILRHHTAITPACFIRGNGRRVSSDRSNCRAVAGSH